MKHSEISRVAFMAACAAARPDQLDKYGSAILNNDEAEGFHQLYDYARQRKFPVAETLARKLAQIKGTEFGFASIADAPVPMQRAFIAFRAVAEALDPFHEPDPEPEPMTEPEQQNEEPGDASQGEGTVAAAEAIEGAETLDSPDQEVPGVAAVDEAAEGEATEVDHTAADAGDAAPVSAETGDATTLELGDATGAAETAGAGKKKQK